MNSLVVVIILLFPVLALWKEAGRLTPLVLCSIGLTPVLLGYAQLDGQYGSHTAWFYAGALGCWFAGYALYPECRLSKTTDSGRARAASVKTGLSVLLLALIVVLFVCYHFSASGVPLFSDDVETERFDFTSSGLFGIPGRMFLFGLPFVVLLVSMATGRRLARVPRWLSPVIWAAYVSAGLLGGFKGGLVTVLGTMLLARTVLSRPLSIRHVAAGWRAMVIFAALLSCAIISLRYKSLGLASPRDVLPYLAMRATTSAAAPGHLAIVRYGIDGSGGEQFLGDVGYFMGKYLPFAGSDPAPGLPFDKQMSAALYHTPISPGAFIVPVTVGAFPELVVNVGVIIAFFGMGLLGVLFAHLVSQARRCTSLFRAATLAFAVYLLQIYLLNGNLVYTVCNFMVMSGILLTIYKVCGLIARFMLRPAVVMPGGERAAA